MSLDPSKCPFEHRKRDVCVKCGWVDSKSMIGEELDHLRKVVGECALICPFCLRGQWEDSPTFGTKRCPDCGATALIGHLETVTHVSNP